MFVYQVVQPFQYAITADSFKDAIKNFVKVHRDLNLTNIIIKDQSKYYQANFNYWFEGGKNKVQISTNPYLGAVSLGPSYIQYYESLPGASGIPLTPPFSSASPLAPVALTPSIFPFSPTAPYTPVAVYTDPFIPTIVEFR